MNSLLKLCLPALIFLAAAAANPTSSRQTEAPTANSARSPIQLLPGYKIELWSGIDTFGGRIWKEGGLTIDFDFGEHLESEADSIPKNQIAWSVAEKDGDKEVRCVRTKASELVISVWRPPADGPRNFRAKIRSDRDVVEMMVMALSWDWHGYLVDPGAVIRRPQSK